MSFIINFFPSSRKQNLANPLLNPKVSREAILKFFKNSSNIITGNHVSEKNFRCLKIENASLLNEINRATVMLVTKLCLRIFRGESLVMLVTDGNVKIRSFYCLENTDCRYSISSIFIEIENRYRF